MTALFVIAACICVGIAAALIYKLICDPRPRMPKKPEPEFGSEEYQISELEEMWRGSKGR